MPGRKALEELSFPVESQDDYAEALVVNISDNYLSLTTLHFPLFCFSYNFHLDATNKQRAELLPRGPKIFDLSEYNVTQFDEN